MEVSVYPPITSVEVWKKTDGFMVRGMDGSIEFLNFFEGLVWRFFKRLPKRFRTA